MKTSIKDEMNDIDDITRLENELKKMRKEIEEVEYMPLTVMDGLQEIKKRMFDMERRMINLEETIMHLKNRIV